MRTWVAVVTFCVLGALAPREAVPKEQKGQRDGLPHMAGASLLIGVPPYFLVVNNPHENIRLQPEYSQPYPRNGGAIYPSISRDGKTIAYARVKSIEHGRVVAISTYSVTTDKHTDYSEGECSGSVAISPDASRLAFPPARPMMGVGDDNSLHIIDLKTGRETLGARFHARTGQCLSVGLQIPAVWHTVLPARSGFGTRIQARSRRLPKAMSRHGCPRESGLSICRVLGKQP